MSMTRFFSGQPDPLGVTHCADDNTNFAVLASPSVSSMSLCIYPRGDPDRESSPSAVVPMTRTGNTWHVAVSGIPRSAHYAFRVGARSSAPVADPYARSIVGSRQWCAPRPRGFLPGESRAEVFGDDCDDFDWEGDTQPPEFDQSPSIYELHVRGFTAHPTSSLVSSTPGTFLAIAECAGYIASLATAVELMPCFEFSETAVSGHGRCNYWGYATGFFFAPMKRFGTAREFKTMVKALHKAGVRVILDVVFNHAESRALEVLATDLYFTLDDRGRHTNYSGCGNTVSCSGPAASFLILDCLRYWADVCRVDGFRFDEATILARDERGTLEQRNGLLWAIARDPCLSKCLMIAESWDAAGGYQQGHFAREHGFAEWNGRFRDTVRSFVKGTDGFAGQFASCLAGSTELYPDSPRFSINFVTCHDGFSLRDLVSFNVKHNEPNGEGNRDGVDSNLSWNCGHEGIDPPPPAEVVELRERQMRNFLVALFVSRGVPMIKMGDEVGMSHGGNNNPWCLDGPVNWLNWSALYEGGSGMWLSRFFNALSTFRRSRTLIRTPTSFTDRDVEWHGLEPGKPDWSPNSRFVALTLKNPASAEYIFVAFSAYWHEVTVHLPRCGDSVWLTFVNTSNPPPNDITDSNPPPVPGDSVTMKPYSSIILIASF